MFFVISNLNKNLLKSFSKKKKKKSKDSFHKRAKFKTRWRLTLYSIKKSQKNTSKFVFHEINMQIKKKQKYVLYNKYHLWIINKLLKLYISSNYLLFSLRLKSLFSKSPKSHLCSSNFFFKTLPFTSNDIFFFFLASSINSTI